MLCIFHVDKIKWKFGDNFTKQMNLVKNILHTDITYVKIMPVCKGFYRFQNLNFLEKNGGGDEAVDHEMILWFSLSATITENPIHINQYRQHYGRIWNARRNTQRILETQNFKTENSNIIKTFSHCEWVALLNDKMYQHDQLAKEGKILYIKSS